MADRMFYKRRVIELISDQVEGTCVPKALVLRHERDVGTPLIFHDAALSTKEAADEYALAAAKRWIDERG